MFRGSQVGKGDFWFKENIAKEQAEVGMRSLLIFTTKRQSKVLLYRQKFKRSWMTYIKLVKYFNLHGC